MRQSTSRIPLSSPWSRLVLNSLAIFISTIIACLFLLYFSVPWLLTVNALNFFRHTTTPALEDSSPQIGQTGFFDLHPEDHVFRATQTLHLQWNVTRAYHAPDGVRKAVYLINGQFPGPVIEARSGDELIIDVYNAVGDDDDGEGGIAVHWHGLDMKDANEMDGVVGLTQCAILPSRQFTYRFRIGDTQSGTFWYHAHAGVQRAEGFYGGLVVHKPADQDGLAPDSSTFNYGVEKLLLVGDWYHRPAKSVLDWFQDPNHYAYEPAPDSLLINGKDYFDCSMAVKAHPVNCSATSKPKLTLPDCERVRIRVVNTGISAGLTLSLSQGVMKLITVDGGNLVATDTPAAPSIGILYPGERMDVVVERAGHHIKTKRFGWKAPEEGLTIRLDGENMALENFALTRKQSFPFRWGRKRKHRSGHRNPQTWPVAPHLNLAEMLGASLEASAPVATSPMEKAVLYTTMLVRAANHNRPVGTVNRTSWMAPMPDQYPLLALDREQWPQVVQQPTTAQALMVPWFRDTGNGNWLELVLNNFDDKGHPFHLHGGDFYLVARHQARPGTNAAYNPFDPAAAQEHAPAVNTANPLRKDTVYVPPTGYVVLRMPLDSSGLWLFHCHVLWHQAVDMGIVLQVGDISQEVKERASALCAPR